MTRKGDDGPPWFGGVTTDDILQYLSETQLRRLRAIAEGKPPLTFVEYVNIVRPHYQWYEYSVRLARVLQRVADDALFRLMVFAPPRLGKSEIISRLFSGYYVYRHPERWVALTSYGADLAYGFSRAAQENYMRVLGAGDQALTSVAVKTWTTGKGGGLWATGVRGPATGKGANLFIIDDPVKDKLEARSPTYQKRNFEWNDNVVETRLEKDAARIIIQTRWDMKDLSGALLERENGDYPEHWHIVCFEAEKLAPGVIQWPRGVTIEPDWRQPGELVCPQRLTPAMLKRAKTRDIDTWNSLYQQNPTPREGGMFRRWWFEIVDRPPLEDDILATIRWWDQAATAGSGDYTAGVKMCKTRSGVYYVLDVSRGQWESGARDATIRMVAKWDEKRVWIGTARDPGAAGKDTERAFRRMLDGYKLRTDAETGSKENRADPLASAARVDNPDAVESQGRVKLVRGDWNEAFLAELASFPRGLHDDQVDAAANAYNQLQRLASDTGRGFEIIKAR